MRPLPETFSCLLWRDRETGLWIGHSLDFDLVTSGKSDDVTFQNLKEVIRVHVEHCFSNGTEALKHCANKESWEAFQKLKDCNASGFRDKIKLNLVSKPKDLGITPIWCEGIELAQASPDLQTIH